MSETENELEADDSPLLPTNVRLLGLVSLLNDTASEMIFPLLPKFIKDVLHGTVADLGLMEGVSETTASVLKLFSGNWSDQAGKRKIFVVVGYLMAALTRPFIGLTTGPWQVFSIRVFDRFGKGIRTAPRDAMIADCTTEKNRGRSYGFHRAMDHLGSILGPLLAILFLYFFPGQYRWLFALSVIPGLMVFLLVVFFLKDSEKPKSETKKLSLSLAPFDWRFRLYLLSLFIFTLGNSSDIFLLNRAEELGASPIGLMVLWIGFHVVKSVGNIIGGAAVDRMGSRPLIFSGWIVYAIIYVLFAFASQIWHVWVLFAFYGIFYALTEPAEKALVANLAGAERKGLAFGLFNLVIGIGALPANILFGLLYKNYGPLAAFGTGAGFAFLAGVLLIAVRPKKLQNA